MIDNGRIIDTGSLQRLQSRNVYIQSLQATGSSTPQENRDETLQIAQNSHEKVLDLHSKDDEGQEREINKEYDSEISLRALPKSASTRKSLIRFSGYSVGWKDDGSPWQSVEGRSSALWMRFVL